MTTPSLNINPVTPDDYRKIAEKKLPRQLFDYLDGGSYQEDTLRDNTNAFSRVKLKQKVLVDVDNVDTSTEILGKKVGAPVILAPVGMGGVYGRRGEVQAFKAAHRHNVPFCLSTNGICSPDELIGEVDNNFWFQLYVLRDREFSKSILQKMSKLGVETLVFTVDLPVLGERYRDHRNGLFKTRTLGDKLKKAWDIVSHPGWVWDVAIKGAPLTFPNLADAVPNATKLEDFKEWVDSQFDPTISWQDISWLRDIWPGKLVIKGILDPDDAEQAVNIGCDAIVVSNHGGRQLDGVSASLDALPAIAKRVKGKCEILIDGGVRSGIDVVKAIAAGADGCLIGRAWVYALAAEGQQGVDDLLTTFKHEMEVAMKLTGVNKISEIDSNILVER